MSISYTEGYENAAEEAWTCSFGLADQSHNDYTRTDQLSVFGGPQELLGMGLSAQQVNSPDFGAVFAVTAGDEGAVVRVDAVRINVYYRSDITIEDIETRRPSGLSGVAIGAGASIIVGAAGRILRSIDHGASWSEIVSGTSADLRRVRFRGGKFFAFGDSGTLIQSADAGLTWTPINTGTTLSLRALMYYPRAGFLTVGRSGMSRFSSDLIAWRGV